MAWPQARDVPETSLPRWFNPGSHAKDQRWGTRLSGIGTRRFGPSVPLTLHLCCLLLSAKCPHSVYTARARRAHYQISELRQRPGGANDRQPIDTNSRHHTQTDAAPQPRLPPDLTTLSSRKSGREFFTARSDLLGGVLRRALGVSDC